MTEPLLVDLADRLHGPHLIQLRIDCDARLHNLRPLLDLFDAQSRCAGIAPELRHDLRLIVEEACMNIIQHAYRGCRRPGRLSLVWESLQHLGRPAVSITLQDDGRPFAPAIDSSLAGRSANAADGGGGWGLALIQRLSDVYRYRREDDGGNSLQLIKYLDSVRADRPGGKDATRQSGG